MGDESTVDAAIEFGRTSGGGGAATINRVWDNPAAGMFDGVEQVPGAAKPDPILIADNVSRSFGGLRAVDVDHVEIQRGAITALIGPNGAGKTTFFNLLTQFDTPDSGAVTFDGDRTSGVRSHELAARGMVRTFQLTKVLAKMTVIDNMMLAAQAQTGESMWRALLNGWRGQERGVNERALQILDEFNMTHMKDEFAGALSGGQRKLLEMARAMMAQPRLIMLDEPMAGVNPALTQSLLGHVKRLRSEGISVMFVEHDMDVVQDISDWVIVMAEGSVIAEGPPRAIGENPAVIDAYLGSSHAALTEEIREAVGLANEPTTDVDHGESGDGDE
ncbi:MAG TPA: ABC transporter ATP-binding protein [Ilumatobacteraceae bacterium]|nr:ABC transporter ATP-binding protein [Ilumatobacteraceae bacterium]